MKTNTIRIISGKYKNRIIKFPNISGLRPTSNRLKETLFNWLSPYIDKSICVDAFAGSGSLGIESLSRGVSKTIFYDFNLNAHHQIKYNLKILNILNFEIYKADSIKSLAKLNIQNSKLIIFIDPPFYKSIVSKALYSIVTNEFIPKGTIIYIETEKDAKYFLDGFDILKEKATSNICLKLITKII